MIYLLIPISIGLLLLGIVRLNKPLVDTGDYQTKSQLEEARVKAHARHRAKQKFPVRYFIIPSIYICVYLIASLKLYFSALFMGWVLLSVLRVFPATKGPRKLLDWLGLIGPPLVLWLSYTANTLVYLQIWLSIVFGLMLGVLLIWPKHIFGEYTSVNVKDKALSFRVLFFPIPIGLIFINEYLRINASDIIWIWFCHFYTIGIMFLTVLIVPLLATLFFKDE